MKSKKNCAVRPVLCFWCAFAPGVSHVWHSRRNDVFAHAHSRAYGRPHHWPCMRFGYRCGLAGAFLFVYRHARPGEASVYAVRAGSIWPVFRAVFKKQQRRWPCLFVAHRRADCRPGSECCLHAGGSLPVSH